MLARESRRKKERDREREQDGVDGDNDSDVNDDVAEANGLSNTTIHPVHYRALHPHYYNLSSDGALKRIDTLRQSRQTFQRGREEGGEGSREKIPSRPAPDTLKWIYLEVMPVISSDL